MSNRWDSLEYFSLVYDASEIEMTRHRAALVVQERHIEVEVVDGGTLPDDVFLKVEGEVVGSYDTVEEAVYRLEDEFPTGF